MAGEGDAGAGGDDEAGGRLAAAPAMLDQVPARLRVEQGLGWGLPTFGVTLVVGVVYGLVHTVSRPGPVDGGVLALVGVAPLLGVLCIALHLRARRRRVVLVPTAGGVAIYRGGRLVGEARGKLTPYAHGVFNTIYLAVALGLALFMAASLGGKDPLVVVLLLPIVAILASALRSRLAFTHVYVLRGEGTAMFPKEPFARAFGDVQRWA
jgi:hypothetical protein